MAARLTRRGRAVAAVAVLALVLGYGFGGRSLNAVVVPAAVLLVAARVYVAYVPEPDVERIAPREGHQGERRTVELVVDAERSYPVTLREQLADGLRGDTVHSVEADGRTVAYDIELVHRGVHAVGPCRARATDPFGLWAVSFLVADPNSVRVFPRVHSLDDTAALLTGYVGITDEREQFAGVREYERGDPLRDVNWKASAKRPTGDLTVTEFVGEGASDRVTIAAEARGPRADSVAEAAASVATHLLDAGIAVGIATPSGRLDPAHGDPHRRRILGVLAAFEQGHLRRRYRDEADIFVHAPESGEHVSVTVDGEDHRYAEFVGSRAGAGGTEVAA
ncbi:DUF58 domain-containing protein [Halobacterium jilantaiense]|uniref:Uncharacterized conserved protein, DUF58 family, contains vWF domain n=1 Tax=Halobacterium jilantaiense TaxID=355548 RepID=A0A1I0PDR8_9EURY|nr:DUF58 domain-containing protein [Halobacterium jilantaiense]SEW12557.1 Uncharacterized conserved protein, DUF58 family, contains vWF domain [Halobacterium jilantaiense]